MEPIKNNTLKTNNSSNSQKKLKVEIMTKIRRKYRNLNDDVQLKLNEWNRELKELVIFSCLEALKENLRPGYHLDVTINHGKNEVTFYASQMSGTPTIHGFYESDITFKMMDIVGNDIKDFIMVRMHYFKEHIIQHTLKRLIIDEVLRNLKDGNE